MQITTNNLSRKSYTALLLSMFDNLNLTNYADEDYQIPIHYANASRLYKKLLSTSESITYRTPIMSLIETSMKINLERSTHRLLKRKVIDVLSTSVAITYTSTPVDFDFELVIIADTLTTLTAIQEHIISIFHNNTYYVDYNSLLGDLIRTPIKLTNIETNIENNESDYIDDRFIEGRFSFTVEGYVENKISSSGNKISAVEVLMNDYSNQIDNIIAEYEFTDGV